MNGANSNTSGQTQAALRFKTKGANDRIPDETIAELQKRGFVVIEVNVEGNLVLSPTAPTDTTKVWRKTDANGVPLGNGLYVYDTAKGMWVPLDTTPDISSQLNTVRFGNLKVPAGNSAATVNFTTVKSSKYHLTLTPTLFVDGGWATPPASVPTGFGWFVTDQGEAQFKVSFFGQPTGGLGWAWRLEVPSEAQLVA